jgi:hypothetical protein
VCFGVGAGGYLSRIQAASVDHFVTPLRGVHRGCFDLIFIIAVMWLSACGGAGTPAPHAAAVMTYCVLRVVRTHYHVLGC